MGSPVSEAGRFGNEGPVHTVCVKAFHLGQYDVTQAEWRRVMIFPNTPEPSFNNDRSLPTADRRRLPVEGVSWNDAQRFIWLMSHFGSGRYRLPSEAEWEYAARAGTTTSRYWGDNIDDACAYENIRDMSFQQRPDAKRDTNSFAHCDDHYIRTAPVGSFVPNPWGLYDMLGNVANWVDDCYEPKYGETPVDGTASASPGCISHVFRGAFWASEPRYVRVARRGPF
jgi:formylglycine-generating enzyme required for sulfatase activity